MKILEMLEKLKRLFRIRQKQIGAPKPSSNGSKEEIEEKEKWRVEDTDIEERARQEQIKKQERQIQLMLAMKNICNGNINLDRETIQHMLTNELRNYGKSDEIVLDELDFDILRDFGNRLHNDIIEYMNESKTPAIVARNLIDEARQVAEEEAKKYASTQPSRFIPNTTEVFRSFIAKEKEKTM